MKRILFALLTLSLFVGCKNSAPLKPSVSGKAGEVLVVIGREDWEGRLGQSTLAVLADEYPFLPTVEPRYSVVNVAPGAFGDLFKVHRNILFYDIRPGARPGVKVLKDMWAAPQCVIQLSARTSYEADSVLNASSEIVVGAIEQAERDRVVANTLLYENKDLHKIVSDAFGGGMHFPIGYKLKKRTDDFIWIADEKQQTMQGVFVYRYPATCAEPFSTPSVIAHRNEVLQANVPGMFEGTYMTTGDYMAPRTRFITYKKRQFAETHGLWEVYGDYMGGPFVCHSFYSPDGKYIVVAEAFVYAPKFDKRQYLRQTESLLYSWEWK